VLSDVLLNLIDKVRWIRRASAGDPSRIREAFSEIHAVLDALEARDAEAASAAMRIHIENTLEFRRPDQSRQADNGLSASI
jgi:DNA-binding GntR family transcriptional regulator